MKPEYRKLLFLRGVIFYFSILLVCLFIHIFFPTGNTLYDFGLLVSIISGFLLIPAIFSVVGSGPWKHQLFKTIPPSERSLPIRDAFFDTRLALSISLFFAATSGLAIIYLELQNGIRQPTPGSAPLITSAKAGIEHIDGYAYQWKSDAYLVDATVHFEKDSFYHFTAGYRSPAAPDIYLHIVMYSDEEIDLQTYNITRDELPILDKNWPIDSQQALNIFAQKDELRFCINQYNEKQKRLELTRLNIEHEKKGATVWELRLWNCSLNNRYYLDAKTGELITIPKK